MGREVFGFYFFLVLVLEIVVFRLLRDSDSMKVLGWFVFIILCFVVFFVVYIFLCCWVGLFFCLVICLDYYFFIGFRFIVLGFLYFSGYSSVLDGKLLVCEFCCSCVVVFSFG